MDILTFVYAIFGIGFLIFVHELGHFLAAKRVGIRVDTFALGFQPTIFGFKARFCAFKWGETEYVIGMLPFGGYVKMAGEEVGDERTGADDEYASKKPNERAQVLVAGALMNLIFGVVFFILAYSYGVPTQTSMIGAVIPGDPAWAAGVRPGDRVVAIDGEPVREFPELFTEIALSSRDEPIQLTLDRNGETVEVEVSPRFDAGKGLLTIGVGQATTRTIGIVGEGSAAEKAGLKENDEVQALSFKTKDFDFTVPESIAPTTYFSLVQHFGTFRPDGELTLAVKGTEGADRSVSITPVEDEEIAKKTAFRVRLRPRTRILRHVQPGSAAADLFDPGLEIVSAGTRDLAVVDLWTVAALPAGMNELRTADGRTISVDRDALFGWIADGVVEFGPEAKGAESDDSRVSPVVVGSAIPGGAAERAGLQTGDLIVEVDSAPVKNFTRFVSLVEAYNGEGSMKFVIERAGERKTLEVTPQREALLFGFAMAPNTFDKKGGVAESIQLGIADTGLWMKRVFLTLKALVKRDVSAKNLAGPLGIIMATKTMSQQGLGKYLWFLALISVNLGVFNLLPFPILDGGHLLFLAIEKIKGSPVNESVHHYAHLIAFLLLIGLALFVTFHDIKRWILN
ncbi:MAG: RIP metalloprotease RseP [Planctomycetota bacterium]